MASDGRKVHVLSFAQELYPILAKEVGEFLLEEARMRETSDDELDKIKQKLPTSTQMRTVVYDMIMNSVRFSLEEKSGAGKKPAEGQQRQGLNLAEIALYADLRRTMMAAIVKSETPIAEVTLCSEEWDLLEPHWKDEGGRDWVLSPYALVCVPRLKELVFDNVVQKDIKELAK